MQCRLQSIMPLVLVITCLEGQSGINCPSAFLKILKLWCNFDYNQSRDYNCTYNCGVIVFCEKVTERICVGIGESIQGISITRNNLLLLISFCGSFPPASGSWSYLLHPESKKCIHCVNYARF